MGFILFVSFIWFCLFSTIHSGKTKGSKEPEPKLTHDQIIEKCEEDTIHEVFAKEVTKCSEEEANIPQFIKDHPDYISYILNPSGMEHYVHTSRTLSKTTSQQQTDLVTDESIQYHLGTADQGRTLLIFFPGTDIDLGKIDFWNQPDVHIDLSAKHREVTLPGIVQEKFLHKDPDDPLSVLLTPNERHAAKTDKFRVHQGIYDRIFDDEIQRALEEDLLYIYSGKFELGKTGWPAWVENSDNTIEPRVEKILIELGFQQTITGVGHEIHGDKLLYTDPKAMDLLSSQWKAFVDHKDITKEDIKHVTKAIQNIDKRVMQRGRHDITTEKVENLIISGHSLGGGYAVLFYLALYGRASLRNAPGFKVFPDDFKKVTVVPFAGPSVVFHEDVGKINPEILTRVTNIWNYEDPVPIMLNGVSGLTATDITWDNVGDYLTDESLMRLASNQPIGNVMIMFEAKKRIQKGSSWKETSKDKRWFKVFPWDTNQRYVKQGGECLWEGTAFGALGALRGALGQHPFSKYKDRIYGSCLLDYLEKHSRHFEEHTFAKLKEKHESKRLFGFRKFFGQVEKRKTEKGTEIHFARSMNEENTYMEHAYGYSDADVYLDLEMLIIVSVVIALVVCMCLLPLGVWCGYWMIPWATDK
eukprot:691239_1